MSHPKILLMHITKTSGHHRATVAIENALKELNPQAETLNLNGFAYVYPILEKIINTAYMSVIKRRPQLWDYLYDNPKVVKKTGKIKKILNNAKQPKLKRLFKRFAPDAVVCTQAFPCGMIGDFKKRYDNPIKLIGVLTDFAPHHYWLHDKVDYYVVPTKEARDRLVQDGIEAKRIKLYGIPIDLKFSKASKKDHTAKDLGLKAGIKTILIMGGGQGIGPIRSIVKNLADCREEFQLVVIAGTNKRILKALRKVKFPYGQDIRVLSYVDNVDELMDCADMIITKPGGMTTAECLSKGLPMVIVNPIPGQEARNTHLLLKKGIAVEIDDLSQVAQEVGDLLRSPEKLQLMREAALQYGKPQAAMDVAKLILEK
ncbi:MAG: glycosyltransferase [Candidatus Aceula meridiana]|nr:glycosyltransferase [Candidatus Aceula meridiana]